MGRGSWWVVVGVLVLGACRSGRAVPLDNALAAVDAAWQPGRPGFEDEVRRALDASLALAPDDPAVLWRLARLQVADGLAEVDTTRALEHFAQARSTAASCLDAVPAVRRRRRASGWGAALSVAPLNTQGCVDQLGWAWTRWWVAADPAANQLDMTPLSAVVPRARGEEGQWASALLEAGLGRAAGDASGTLEALDGRHPLDLAPEADRIALILVPAGDADAVRRALDALLQRVRHDVPRDAAALRRAQLAADGGW